MNEPNPSDAVFTQSSVFERIHEPQRRKVNRAIINRDPPTFRAVYEKFALADAGVSFSAFWRYAHRLRRHAEMQDLRELRHPADDEIPQLLPHLIAQSLLASLTHESTSPRGIRDLLAAYKLAVRTVAETEDRAERRRKQADWLASRQQPRTVQSELCDIAARLKALDPAVPAMVPDATADEPANASPGLA